MKNIFTITTKRKKSSPKEVRRLLLLAISVIFCVANIGQYVSAAVDYDFYNSNNILYIDPSACDPNATTSSDSSAGLSGGAPELEIWTWLTDPAGGGLTGMQAAGIMGNMDAESSFNPDAKEGPPLNGYGLVQWTGSRHDALDAAAAKQKVAVSDLLFQLKYMVAESKSRAVTTNVVPAAGSEWDTLKTINTVENATLFWHDNFEISKDTLAQIMNNRVQAAVNIYAKYKGVSTPPSQGSGTSLTGPTAKPVIFLDPGHGAAIPDYTDPASGLVTNETANTPESADVLDVANLVKTALEKPDANGQSYDVQLARDSNSTAIKFRDRADLAAKDNALIGISIHTSPGASDNTAWYQHIGGFRQYGNIKEVFGTTAQEQATSKLSLTYANTMASARDKAFAAAYPNMSQAELASHAVSTDTEKPGFPEETASFGRGGNIKTTGNIPLVALWSPKVPWVYDEITQDGPGASITAKTKQAYANGIIDAVKSSVPIAPVSANQCGGGTSNFAGGNFEQTLAAYAWPNYRGHPYLIMTPAYEKAVAAAQASGRYVGGLAHPGVDCGGFVTTLMVDSGFEPNYNYGGKAPSAGTTVAQEAWLKAHWRTVGSSDNMDASQLRPGDVAINSEHTFVYAGTTTGPSPTAPPGFQSNTASASVAINTTTAWRTPMAGSETPNLPGFTWYSKYPK